MKRKKKTFDVGDNIVTCTFCDISCGDLDGQKKMLEQYIFVYIIKRFLLKLGLLHVNFVFDLAVFRNKSCRSLFIPNSTI